MKKSIRTFGRIALVGVTATTILASTAWAEEEKPTADLSASFLSKYVWRGYELSKDSLVIQPSMTVGYKGFSMNLWGNLDTDNDLTETNEFNETDVTLSYAGSCSFADYSVGYIYYALDGADDTQEVYASAGLKTLLTPTLTIYRDYDSFPGWYITADISHSFPVSDDLSLDLGAKIGYLDVDDESTKSYRDDPTDAYSEFHDAVISASMAFPLGQYFSITPEIYYSFPLTSDAEDDIEDSNLYSNDSDYIYGGVTLSMSF